MKKTLADFQPLKPAEQKLLECCQSGEEAIIGKKIPTKKAEENEMRAEFLRWLILFSKIEIDPIGIQFEGVWISGMLDLENGHSSSVLGFSNSVFEEILFLRSATTKSIYLDGSLFKKGIDANRLFCQGNLHLRHGFSAKAEVSLVGAKVEGNFSCQKGLFKALDKDENALNCNVINVGKSVHVSDGFSAEGKVCFINAKVEGHFVCEGGTFKAIDEEKCVLECDGMNVKGALLLRKRCVFHGGMNLTHATVSALSYDKAFWEQESLKEISLDGFKYGHIYNTDKENNNDIKASFFLKSILGKMSIFKPQPYKQLAKVLRDMGHSREADEVMIALTDNRLELQKDEGKEEAKKYIFSNSMRILSLKISHILWKIYRLTSLYGYRPMRAFGIMIFVWLSCGLIYDYSAKRAVFAPTNPLIYKPKYQDQSQEMNCTLDANGTPWFASAEDYNTSKNNWYYATHAEYTTFQPYWYSLDIILPIVDLKMENDWSVAIPSPHGSFFETYNYFVRSLVWIESLIGWGLSLMLAAILSGLAKNEKE